MIVTYGTSILQATMYKIILVSVSLLVLTTVALIGSWFWVMYNYGRSLPDYKQLEKYEPAVMTRVHAGDGRLLAEFAVEKRVFVPIDSIPPKVINAFLSAEDKNFFTHSGLDPKGILRAILTNIKNIGSGRRLVGASTITQQVAKNFLLTSEVSVSRKIKEAILSFRIEHAFDKNKILELYLNEIYLGFGSYGVAAAALNYFNKSLDELSIAEAAFLAALPKAPNKYNPVSKPRLAENRRNWVIRRMLDDGHITGDEAETARQSLLTTFQRDETEFVEAPYFTEEVRRELFALFGKRELYKGGLSVRTTINPQLQKIAKKVLRHGLETYDRRHGYRGPVARFQNLDDLKNPLLWQTQLAKIVRPKGSEHYSFSVVLNVESQVAEIGIDNGSRGTIPISEAKWARKIDQEGNLSSKIKDMRSVLSIGDIVLVRLVKRDPTGKQYSSETFTLGQIPKVDGSVVVMDPHTGRVLAMTGGYSYQKSEFNRATQALRQPGSAFKPFVYLAALESGYNPSTRILDAPYVVDQGAGLPKWRPSNYTKKFYGPSTMRLGLEKSRNLMTIRLAQTVGMQKVVELSDKFGITTDLPQTLANSLGAGETTLLRLTSAYAMLVNGGKRVVPAFIDRIQDRTGRTVLRHDQRTCNECEAKVWSNQVVPSIPDERQNVTTAGNAFQIVNMLKGVIERGTGRRIRVVGKPLAGKTGTTNNERDTWFLGFSPDLAVGVYVGFDIPKPLGRKETGSSVAAPIFRDFMAAALEGKPNIPFRIPPGIRLVRVDPKTGRPAKLGDKNFIYEAFKPGEIPSEQEDVIKGYDCSQNNESCGGVNSPSTGTGGLY